MPPHGPHGPHGAGRKEKPKNASKTLRRLVARLKPFIPLLVIVFIFTVAGTLCNTVSPLVLGQATTEVFSAFERVMAALVDSISSRSTASFSHSCCSTWPIRSASSSANSSWRRSLRKSSMACAAI